MRDPPEWNENETRKEKSLFWFQKKPTIGRKRHGVKKKLVRMPAS